MSELLNSNGLRALAYLVAGLLCLVASTREVDAADSRTQQLVRLFWLGLAAMLVVLAFSRMFDLGPWLTDRGRDMAKAQGWYDERRRFQSRAVEAILLAGAMGVFIGVLWFFRAAYREHPLAFIAAVYIVCFVLVRAISLHQVDSVLYRHPVHGVRVNALLELAGIGLMIAAAAVPLLRPGEGTAPPLDARGAQP
ncbi:MAG TPA: hypothetical protein VIH21_04920 [Dehalococcoidia bacterium]